MNLLIQKVTQKQKQNKKNSPKQLKQAARTAAKSRHDTLYTTPSSSPAVSSSLTPPEIWIDRFPFGDSFISCPPPFAPLRGKIQFEKKD